MENATKALIIAAAVLIAIVIIAFGLRIINAGRGTLSKGEEFSTDMEVSVVNSQFEAYTGKNIEGSKVKKLARKVISYNAPLDKNTITLSLNGGANYNQEESIKKNIIDKIDSSKLYKVEIDDYYGNGLIHRIAITE